jgi:hypothetical protein
VLYLKCERKAVTLLGGAWVSTRAMEFSADDETRFRNQSIDVLVA